MKYLVYNDLKYYIRDFPGGPMVKTLPSSAGDAGPFPGQGAKIPHALWPKPKTKQKQYCNKFNSDFKNGPHQKKQINKILDTINISFSIKNGSYYCNSCNLNSILLNERISHRVN